MLHCTYSERNVQSIKRPQNTVTTVFPFTVSARVWETGDPKDVTDGEEVYKEVGITSFVLDPLSASIECNEATAHFGEMYVVMKDGTRILMQETYGTIKAEMPIVLSEADHILFADGTKLPMPE